jgi:hypothetical protein
LRGNPPTAPFNRCFASFNRCFPSFYGCFESFNRCFASFYECFRPFDGRLAACGRCCCASRPGSRDVLAIRLSSSAGWAEPPHWTSPLTKPKSCDTTSADRRYWLQRGLARFSVYLDEFEGKVKLLVVSRNPILLVFAQPVF